MEKHQVPSDVIVDASMAAAVRDAGRMWTKASAESSPAAGFSSRELVKEI